MLTYCLKCKKYTESIDSKMLKTKMVKKCYHENVLYVVGRNQNLSKNKKQKDD